MPILPGLAPICGIGHDSCPSRSILSQLNGDATRYQSSSPIVGSTQTTDNQPSAIMNISSELYLRFFTAPLAANDPPNDAVSPVSTSSLVMLQPTDVFKHLNPHIHEGRQLISEFADALNALGRASAHAQGLRMPITSYKRFIDSDHRLYLLATAISAQHTESSPHRLVGLLKVGHKKLYLNNATGHLHECYPLCVLDFYVSETSQRQGYGRVLFEHMLSQEHVVDPSDLAYDRPSPKMVAFLRRHFGLVEGLPQPNNYMVFQRQHTSQDDQGGFVTQGTGNSSVAVGILQSKQQQARPRTNRHGLPPLFPVTLPSVATSRLPELRRAHSTASSASSLHSASSASSLSDPTKACLQWPPTASPLAPHHHDVALTAEGPIASKPTSDAAARDNSRPSAPDPLSGFPGSAGACRRHHQTTRITLGKGCMGGMTGSGDRSAAIDAAALKARGAILPHLSMSSVVGRR